MTSSRGRRRKCLQVDENELLCVSLIQPLLALEAQYSESQKRQRGEEREGKKKKKKNNSPAHKCRLARRRSASQPDRHRHFEEASPPASTRVPPLSSSSSSSCSSSRHLQHHPPSPHRCRRPHPRRRQVAPSCHRPANFPPLPLPSALGCRHRHPSRIQTQSRIRTQELQAPHVPSREGSVLHWVSTAQGTTTTIPRGGRRPPLRPSLVATPVSVPIQGGGGGVPARIGPRRCYLLVVVHRRHGALP